MSTHVIDTRDAPASAASAGIRRRQQRWLADLDHPGQLLSNITPNCFASVMGTGIVATAAASLPVSIPGLRPFATLAWALAALWLTAVTAATAAHWVRHRDTARRHHQHAVMAHFYGAPPMALLTVGAGTLVLGKDVIGLSAALVVDWTLWTLGTVLGLASAVLVPFLQFTRHRDVTPESAFGGWLMPVVPPMVSATTGGMLIPYVAPGAGRELLLAACYAMFGLSLIASLIVITLIWNLLAVHKVGAAAMVPTLWIVLGPLGQSMTAANVLADAAPHAMAAPYADAFRAFALVYSLPVWGFAMLWAAVATAVTVGTARAGLPFSLTWWSFTFPVGTCVTAASGLALHTGLPAFRWAAAVLYTALVGAWLLVGIRTVLGVYRGTLLRPPAAA
ncbi:TDT family transporter [Nakamurella aerolata]|uniref:TDT family transporter n=1 Tax=Nakamurella aerolata TaxID=1656892 RepID=A0A849AD90_9ACTN|nr:TDT family transporter [Nakamurella aerolata]NNG37546.1 TDT family transporter [Nakamurella aerolata]